jgi:hypothetical protein
MKLCPVLGLLSRLRPSLEDNRTFTVRLYGCPQSQQAYIIDMPTSTVVSHG